MFEQNDLPGKARILTQAQQSTDVEVTELRKELELCKINNHVLNGTVERLAQELKEIKTKSELKDLSTAKNRMLVLSGFESR